MTNYDAGVYSALYNTDFGKKLWKFLNHEGSLIRMKTATDLRRPAVEGIEESLLEEFGDVEPYATIYEAELRHADALVNQLERIGAEVPENPYIGQIAAPADLQAAAQAWAEGEVANAELYDKLLSLTDDPQLVKVLNNLRSASLDSHLPAFEEAAENGGVLDDMSGSDHSANGKGQGGHGRNA